MRCTMLPTDRESYEDPRYATLVQDIEEAGLEESLMAVELRDGQKVLIEGKDGTYMAKGPGVLFVTMLPMEAFEEE